VNSSPCFTRASNRAKMFRQAKYRTAVPGEQAESQVKVGPVMDENRMCRLDERKLVFIPGRGGSL